MIYLQLFADKEALLEPFDDAERGRLLSAMMAYAFRGEQPELTGNERYIWPVFRQMIDQSRDESSTRINAWGWIKEVSPENAVIPLSSIPPLASRLAEHDTSPHIEVTSNAQPNPEGKHLPK